MIVFNRSASIAPGKTGSAVGFAREIASYMKSNYDINLEVLLPIGGNPQRIAWSARYKDLAALESINTKLLADKHYRDIAGKGVDNFLPGSLRDAIWQTV